MSAHREGALRYLVDSHSRQGVQHVVELDAWPGDGDCNGACTCEAFGFRCEPHLRNGHEPDERLRCRHIKEARAAFTGDMLLAILEADRKAAAARRRKNKA